MVLVTRHPADGLTTAVNIAASLLGAMYVLKRRGIGGGASTALNFLASLHKAWHGRKVRGRLTIVTIIGDPGEYYKATYFNSTWVDEKFVDEGGMKALRCWRKAITRAINIGSNFVREGLHVCSLGRDLKRPLY
ncbi:hypothetical protein Aduo_011077 [Ancylostoma duodenale]